MYQIDFLVYEFDLNLDVMQHRRRILFGKFVKNSGSYYMWI